MKEIESEVRNKEYISLFLSEIMTSKKEAHFYVKYDFDCHSLFIRHMHLETGQFRSIYALFYGQFALVRYISVKLQYFTNLTLMFGEDSQKPGTYSRW